jgi:hypothetical protein
VVSFTPRPQGKSTWYPLDKRLGELQSCSGRGGQEKNSQVLKLERPNFTFSTRNFSAVAVFLFFSFLITDYVSEQTRETQFCVHITAKDIFPTFFWHSIIIVLKCSR